MTTLDTIAVTENADTLYALMSVSNSSFSSNESARKQKSHLSATRGFSCLASGSDVSSLAKSTALSAAKVFSDELSRIKTITSILREADMKLANRIK